MIEALAPGDKGLVTTDLLDALEHRLLGELAKARTEMAGLKTEIAQVTIKNGIMIAAALGILLALQKSPGLQYYPSRPVFLPLFKNIRTVCRDYYSGRCFIDRRKLNCYSQ